MDTLELAHLLIETILDKKGSNITLLDIREQALFADYFLICEGENERQLLAMAESIRQDAKEKANLVGGPIEGDPSYGWVLIDFGDLIVHLFSPEKRRYYNLEELWGEAHTVLSMQ